jgi:GNAT superfamily N-acetyltransferase
MTIDIRQAETKDCDVITQLSHQLGYESTTGETEKRLDAILNNGENCVFVAVVNESILGWIHGFYSLRLESDSFVEIGGMVIDERLRRMGIGKKLVEKVSEWSTSRGCPTIRVRCNVVRKSTHEFYEGIGFREIKAQKIFEKKI